ncbi:MAG: flagellar assembly protein FliX [Pseudomonadota bacterium]|nr:flagellar assembly protein FliX [Pseudomonadota bacterium]
MVVVGVSRSNTGRVAPFRRVSEGRPFAVKADAAAQTDETVATSSVSVTSLLTLQEAESGLHQDREARRHGEAVIDQLTELQHSLLSEEGPDLGRLAALVARPITASDPALAGLLRAVRLRAGIELARRGRATSM